MSEQEVETAAADATSEQTLWLLNQIEPITKMSPGRRKLAMERAQHDVRKMDILSAEGMTEVVTDTLARMSPGVDLALASSPLLMLH